MADHTHTDRRTFLQLAGGVVGAAVAGADGTYAAPQQTATGPSTPFAAPPIPEVRIGFVGVGGQGGSHVRNMLGVPGVRITAVCDIAEDRVKLMQKWVVDAGQKEPTGYSRGPRDFERLCETEDLDLVFNATPWEWHVPVCVAAMKNGKHAATEVPAAMTLDDCWQLVEHAEKYRKHCVMMENCNYDRPEMMVFNMVRQGVFGEVLHAEGGYLHDLRDIKFSNKGEGLWRRAWAQKVNANLYPTHGLGPVANCMDINRGDRFEYPGVDERPIARPSGVGKRALPRRRTAEVREVRPGRCQRVPYSYRARPHDLCEPRHEPAPAGTAVFTSSRERVGCFRAIRIAFTSRARAPSTSGRMLRPITRSTSTRSGSSSPSNLKAPATAAWTTSKTIASSSVSERVCQPT